MKILRFFDFWRYEYSHYKSIGCKLFEAFEWYERLFRARDVKKWKEKHVTYEEAHWARLFGIRPEKWKPLGDRKLSIAMAWPIAPDGIKDLYTGVTRTLNKNGDMYITSPEYVGKISSAEYIPMNVDVDNYDDNDLVAFGFNIPEIEKIEAIIKLRQNPFGMQAICYQLRYYLLTLCNAQESDMIEVSHIVDINRKDEKKIIFWMEKKQSTVSSETFLKHANDLSNEVKRYMPDFICEVSIF